MLSSNQGQDVSSAVLLFKNATVAASWTFPWSKQCVTALLARLAMWQVWSLYAHLTFDWLILAKSQQVTVVQMHRHIHRYTERGHKEEDESPTSILHVLHFISQPWNHRADVSSPQFPLTLSDTPPLIFTDTIIVIKTIIIIIVITFSKKCR